MQSISLKGIQKAYIHFQYTTDVFYHINVMRKEDKILGIILTTIF